MVEHLTAFARYLRSKKYLVGLDRIPDAAQSLVHVGLDEREDFVRALQITWCASKEEWVQLKDHLSGLLERIPTSGECQGASGAG